MNEAIPQALNKQQLFSVKSNGDMMQTRIATFRKIFQSFLYPTITYLLNKFSPAPNIHSNTFPLLFRVALSVCDPRCFIMYQQTNRSLLFCYSVNLCSH